ncbi:hypothetical protein LLH00_07890 [bacterium]|nr:hypothetical protein [bacterium]
MKVLYVTDLHGRKAAYEKAAELAHGCGARAIVNGGDLYPLGPDLFAVQKQFLEGWFRQYLDSLSSRGILFLATLGNMDLAGLDGLFREVMAGSGCGRVLLDEAVELDGWYFIGSPLTTDAPFALKDRCRRDRPDSTPPPVSRTPLLSGPDGLYPAPDWNERCLALPDLGASLDRLPCPPDQSRAVYVLHQPPQGLGLGIIESGADVGSLAVRSFLERVQPRLSLHGHIHESPSAGGRWRAALGPTVCVQPGQLPGDSLVTVTLELESLAMSRKVHDL